MTIHLSSVGSLYTVWFVRDLYLTISLSIGQTKDHTKRIFLKVNISNSNNFCNRFNTGT